MHVLVTNGSLLDHWLRAHKDSQSGLEAVPGQVEAALNSDAFYTHALETDAAFSKNATLPITKPAQATFAVALLGARSQDIRPLTPDEIVIAVVEAERVFVFNAPADAMIKTNADVHGDLARIRTLGRGGAGGLHGFGSEGPETV